MKNKKGFTFIELMVVIAIIGIMTAVILVSQQDTKNARTVQTAGRNLTATIRELQNNAVTGKQIVDASSTKVICGYGIIVSGGNSYDLFYNYYDKGTPNANCDSVGTTYDNSKSSKYVSASKFGNNVTTGTSMTVFYSVPYGSVAAADAANAFLPLPKPITLTFNSKNYLVCIYPSGRIEEPGVGVATCP